MRGNSSPTVVEELQLEDLRDEDLGVSSIFRHTARAIPDDIVSAIEYQGEHAFIYVLLKYNEKYYWPIYAIRRRRLLTWTDVTLLNRIECRPETSPAGIDPNLVEKLSDLCIRAWCDERHYKVELVIRTCVLYLHPSGKAIPFEDWMEKYLEQG